MEEMEYIKAYLDDLEGVAELSEEENQNLIARLRAGEDVENALIEGNLYLVPGIAGDYLESGLLAGDLIQEGNMALIQAVSNLKDSEEKIEHVDEYFAYIIDSALQGYVAEESREALASRKLEEMSNRLLEVTREFEEENNRPATLAELAQLMKIDEDEVESILRVSYSAMELGDTADDENENPQTEKKNPLTDGWG